MKNLTIALLILCMAPFGNAIAAESNVPLDRAPVNIKDNASLQRGADTFVNYCLRPRLVWRCSARFVGDCSCARSGLVIYLFASVL